MNKMNYECELCGKPQNHLTIKVCPPIPLEMYTKWLCHSAHELSMDLWGGNYYFDVCDECFKNAQL